MSPIILFLFAIPGAIIFLLGRYIGNTGYVEILKQYDEKKAYDRQGLSNHVKRLMTLTGLLTIGASLTAGIGALFVDNDNISMVFLVFYILVTLHYVVKLRLSCRRFEIKE